MWCQVESVSVKVQVDEKRSMVWLAVEIVVVVLLEGVVNQGSSAVELG